MINTVGMQECISGKEPLSGIYEDSWKKQLMASLLMNTYWSSIKMIRSRTIRHYKRPHLQQTSTPSVWRDLWKEAHKRTSRVNLSSSLSLEVKKLIKRPRLKWMRTARILSYQSKFISINLRLTQYAK